MRSFIITVGVFAACWAMSSCQTVQGMGRDIDNAGKSLFGPKKIASPREIAKPASPPPPVEAVPENARAQALSEAPVPAQRPRGKPIFQEMWKGISDSLKRVPLPFKPSSRMPAAAHSDQIPLEKLEPKIAKKGMFKKQEEPEDLVLKDLPAKTDIQEIPTGAGAWKEANTVDLDGDGLPDVRYRQR